ncbi:MAG: S1 RNA-binding domain-containing protein, partial [Phototrophicaceae bacterium]
QAWKTVEQIKASDLNLHLSVHGYNRGGLLVKWDVLHGFVPSSQLIDFPSDISESDKTLLLQNKIGQVLKLRVIEIAPEHKRLVLSERAAQIEPGERFIRLSRLKVGQEIVGTITNLTDFGAFVDIGGIEGLVHISEISWGRVNHPNHFLHLYESIRTHILQVEPRQGKLALSIKRLQPDPWQTVHHHYNVGQVIAVVVSGFVKYGVFVRIADGLEGLIHCSELDEMTAESLQVGKAYPARILNIEPTARRFGLSFKDIS